MNFRIGSTNNGEFFSGSLDDVAIYNSALTATEVQALASGPLTLDRFCGARHLLVSFSGRPYGFVDEALTALGRSRRVVITVNQFFTAGQVVASSNLLTVLPRHFVGVTGIADQLVLRDLPFEAACLAFHATQRAIRTASGWLQSSE